MIHNHPEAARRCVARSSLIALPVAFALSLAGLAQPAPAGLKVTQKHPPAGTPDRIAAPVAVDDLTCNFNVGGNFCLLVWFSQDLGAAITDGQTTRINFTNPTIGEQLLLDEFGIKNCVIRDVNVAVELTHEYVGELQIDAETGTPFGAVTLYGPTNCSGVDMDAIFDDDATVAGASVCNEQAPPAVAGSVLPAQPLSAFDGLLVASSSQGSTRDWGLAVTDTATGNTGVLHRFGFAWDMHCEFEVCSAARSLSCTSPLDSWSNDGPGSSDTLDEYTCLAGDYGGSELVYSFIPTTKGVYRLTLSGHNADLDLVVLGPDTCNPNRCVAVSDNPGTAEEALIFRADAGQEYFIVVDGFDGATSDYTLQLTCPSRPQADFAFSPAHPSVGDTVRFFDTSDGTPSARLWNFGDGSAASSVSPKHTFTSPGTFQVSLRASNDLGSTTKFRNVVVAPDNASIDLSGPESGEAGETLTFHASAMDCTPNPSGWLWRPAGGTGAGTSASASLRWESPGAKVLRVGNTACGRAVGTLEVGISPRPASSPPAAPGQLGASGVSSTAIRLGWQDNSNDEDGFVVERRASDGSFRQLALVPANESSVIITGLRSRDTPTDQSVAASGFETSALPSNAFRVTALNSAGTSSTSNEASASTVPEPCVPDTETLCLQDKRFKVQVEWQDFDGNRGVGKAVALTEDTGYFWFFQPGNVEVVLKVLDGTSFNDHFWVFYGALSDVEYRITVIDSQTGEAKSYFNPANQFASVGDNQAFPEATATNAAVGYRALEDGLSWAAESLGFVAEAQGALGINWAPKPAVANQETLFVDTGEAASPFVSWLWSFGDGTESVTTTEPAVKHSFAGPGTFPVTMSRVDLASAFVSTVTQDVQVLQTIRPEVDISGPEEAPSGESTTFAATAQNCSPNAGGWVWDVAGGDVTGPSTGSSIQIAWSDTGPKTIGAANTKCGDASDDHAVDVVGGQTPTAVCEPSDTVLCLGKNDNDNRFRVEVNWTDPDGSTGPGHAVRLTSESGYFWFRDDSNVELILKVLDGRSITGHFWVFYGALSNVEYTITVTDTQTGNVYTRTNPQGEFGSVGETQALPGD